MCSIESAKLETELDLKIQYCFYMIYRINSNLIKDNFSSFTYCYLFCKFSYIFNLLNPSPNNSMQNNNPFEFFKEQLDSDDNSVRVNTIHKIPIIATLMSTDAIKNTMLPFLDAMVKKEDDQIVFAIAQQLANIGPMLGAQHTNVLPQLQNLCSHDQTVVRQRAVKSLIKLVGNYTENQINNFIIPLILRLATNDANFTARVSATLLMPAVYSKSGANKEKIRTKFTDISNEQMLLLQRVTATKIPEMCQVYEKQFVLSSLIGILKHRSTDQQDQIRVLATQSFKQVAKILTKDENKTFIMPLIIQAAEDKSWRVRLCLSRNFTLIASNFGKEVTDMSLIQTFGNLLKDSQVDVKLQAVKNLSQFAKIISSQRVNVLVPQVVALGKDPLTIVRSYVGGVITNILPFIAKDQIYQAIQPLIKDLLKDDNQEVRKGGIHAAAKLIQVLGPEMLGSIEINLKQCLEDVKWRVRLQTIKALINLALKMKNPEFFKSKLEPMITTYLKDRASAIRVAAIEKIQDLVKVYGANWVNPLIERLSDILVKDPCFHFKIAAIYTIRQVMYANDQYLDKGISLIFQASNENVPNVRQACVKAQRDLALKYMKSPIKDQIKKHLQSMVQDSDFEVRNSTIHALQTL